MGKDVMYKKIEPIISSKKNKTIKNILFIRNNPLLYQNMIFVEGMKHVRDFLNSSLFSLSQIFISQDCKEKNHFSKYENKIILTPEVFSYLTDVQENQGIIAIFVINYVQNDYSVINLEKPTFILDGVSDPGNMGTIIRTAGALEREYIILIGGCNPFNQKVIRASAGILSRIKILIFFSHGEILNFIKKINKNILGMDMKGELMIIEDRKKWDSYFVVLGNEGQGISREISDCIDTFCSLPMASYVESLNVSIVAGVMGYVLWGIK